MTIEAVDADERTTAIRPQTGKQDAMRQRVLKLEDRIRQDGGWEITKIAAEAGIDRSHDAQRKMLERVLNRLEQRDRWLRDEHDRYRPPGRQDRVDTPYGGGVHLSPSAQGDSTPASYEERRDES